MRLLLLPLLCGLATGMRGVHKKLFKEPISLAEEPDFEEQWYNQSLDHFNMFDDALWRQRYWSNMEYHEAGGPSLIMIGGEAAANPKWMNSGVWYSIAKETKAAMFLLEHRFYGKSMPTDDMKASNMRYLSSRQGLEDLATFITAMNSKHNLTGPWVSFGGSYPGSLSAWLRLKYPHLISGAVSSSGPLFAKLDYFEYLGIVQDSLATTGPGCIEPIKEAIEDLEAKLNESMQWPQLSTNFKTCKGINGNNLDDVKSFIELLVDNLAGIVQYNGRTPFDINSVCDIMRNESLGTPLDRFAAVNSVSLANDGEECLDHEFSSFLSQLTNTTFNSNGVGWRQWTWQTCTEFGWYQTSNQSMVFGRMLDLDFFKSWCRKAFSEVEWSDADFDEFMMNSNTEYGGFTPNVKNVVFVHGSVDPWHPMGVLEDLNDNAPALFINGTSHCADMYDDKPGDSQDLLDAKDRVRDLVKTWLNGKEDNGNGSSIFEAQGSLILLVLASLMLM